MSSGLSKAAVERHQRTILELLKQPGNDVCADCRTRNPRWASWNLGIFICVKCAGIHRKMGTHISKVKSLTLDTWTKEQVERMKSTGNLRANKHWNPNEAKNPPPTDLEESERDSQLEKFIRKKYESRVFTTEAAPPPIEPVPQKAPLVISPTLVSPSYSLGSNGSRPLRSSSAVSLHNQQIRSASLQTPGVQRKNLKSNGVSESFYAQNPSSVQSLLAPVPPVRPSTAPIPYATNSESAPPLPPLPPSMSFPVALNSAPPQVGISNMSGHPPSYPLRQTSNPVISPTSTMRTDGIWGDLLQLSNPVVSAPINQSGLNLNNGHLMQTSISPAWHNSTTLSTPQQTLPNPAVQTSSYTNMMTSNLNQAVNLGAPNQTAFHTQITPHQHFSNQSRSVSTPVNLASTNPFNMTNFLPSHMTSSVLPTNPFSNSGHMSVNNSFPSNNPFAAAAAATATSNSFQPGGRSFSANSAQPLSVQQQMMLQQQRQQQQQQQQQQQPTQAHFSFHNPYA